MKKVVLIVASIVMTLSLYAEANLPFNHNATLIPEKASLASGGFNVDLNQLMLEFTQGIKGTNLHAKLAVEPTEFIFEALLSHKLFTWNEIDMGFSYGAQLHQDTRFVTELTPSVLWNMSHKFNEVIDFYGGSRFKLNFALGYSWNGTSWGYNNFFIDPDWSLYMGTQIDIAKNLELYIELQPGLLSSRSNAYIGVSYYIPKANKSQN
jgi:hypothetical protein